MNPAVRTIVDSMRPCHEPPVTREAVWSVYDTVTADALSMQFGALHCMTCVVPDHRPGPAK